MENEKDDYVMFSSLRADQNPITITETSDPNYYLFDGEVSLGLHINEITQQTNPINYFISINITLIFKMPDSTKNGFELTSDYMVNSKLGKLFLKEDITENAKTCIANLYLDSEKKLAHLFYTNHNKFTFKLHDLNFWKKQTDQLLFRYYSIDHK